MRVASCGPWVVVALIVFASVTRAQCQPSTSTLFDGLWGAAEGTTGGLCGQIYVVTRTDDSLEPGTLRYGVEVLSGPTWIVFDPVVFPPAIMTPIYLQTTLRLRDDLTIDGRGSYVSLRKVSYWEDARWEVASTSVCECFVVDDPAHHMGPNLRIISASNVIITHIDFRQEYAGTLTLPPQCNGRTLDKQCFGDVIEINNTAGTESELFYDNIWIHRSEFRDCGDECIGVTYPSTFRRAHLTISNNKIYWSYKGVLLGLLNNEPFHIVASVYRNHFVGNGQRQPRVENTIARVFNNAYEDWGASGINAKSSSRVMVEGNVFRAVSNPNDPWVVTSTDDVSLWARDNWFAGVSSPGDYETHDFPACSSAGGPWYYDCDLPVIPVASMSYQTAIDTLRGYAGWAATANDVRPFAFVEPGSTDGLRLNKTPGQPGWLTASWNAGCSSALTDYALHEGQLGDWYDHVAIDCSDEGLDRSEAFLPGAGDRYYLVVPRTVNAEGSFGLDSAGIVRPRGLASCAPGHLPASCP